MPQRKPLGNARGAVAWEALPVAVCGCCGRAERGRGRGPESRGAGNLRESTTRYRV